jgi:nitrogen regulatory protein P-II 2
MAELTTLKLVTIIVESVLEERVLRDLRRCGARGYTITPVRGEGTRGRHTDDWVGRHQRIETLVAPAVAEKILEQVGTYFRDFALVAYAVDAQVVRGDKFTGEAPEK